MLIYLIGDTGLAGGSLIREAPKRSDLDVVEAVTRGQKMGQAFLEGRLKGLIGGEITPPLLPITERCRILDLPTCKDRFI